MPKEAIKKRLLQWFGHVIRLEEIRMPRRGLERVKIEEDVWEDHEQDGRFKFRRVLKPRVYIEEWWRSNRCGMIVGNAGVVQKIRRLKMMILLK